MKKRWILLAAAVLMMALTLGGAQADEVRFGVVYGNDTVNLRQQATQNSTWLGLYPSGTWMTITGESGNWYQVSGPDGKTGYMSKNFVQVNKPQYSAIGVVSNDKPSAYLNLRAQPSYTARVVDYYYNGVPCVLLSHANGWYHVRVDGVDGYFREEYITCYTAAYSEDVATIVTPNNSGLNLRSGPGKNWDVMGQYKGGQYVMVLQRGNDWWKVSMDGKVGFMDASFLADGVVKPYGSSGSAAMPGQSGVGTAVVSNPKATQVLNLRAQASTSSQVLGQFRNGAKLTVLARGTEWCKVQAEDGTIGYMMTEFLSLQGMTGSPTMTVDHPQGTFVNLRSYPSMIMGAVQTRIPHGTSVTVLAPSSSGWVKVLYQGMTGYAVDYFLK